MNLLLLCGRTNKVLSVKRHKEGYEVRKELIPADIAGGQDFEMDVAYTPNGDYIGEPAVARRLIKKMGIVPQKIDDKSNICTIGYSTKDGKWYGWSHRGIAGFKPGYKVKKGDSFAGEGEFKAGDVAETTEDAKRMAIAFAKSVS